MDGWVSVKEDVRERDRVRRLRPNVWTEEGEDVGSAERAEVAGGLIFSSSIVFAVAQLKRTIPGHPKTGSSERLRKATVLGSPG